ncbi:MAG TPA: serine/threonine-protein kinase [Gemmata sp.]|nr:serine/threonine-protein kinase [Gemmata sp.]
MTGARVGNWYLEAEIGHGTLGVVYRARGYDDPDRRAAVKVFTGTGTQDAAFVQKFSAEMLPLQRLDHANIAKFYDSGTHGGLAFVACELVEGEDYAKLLASGRRSWREVLGIAVQAARALKHAHNRNVLHRDLKPAHLMMTPDGTLKVLSFGLTRVVLAPPPSPTPAIGSAAYIPPETASGKALTRRSDFYSLGGVLYTLVTGRPPFAAASLVELMHKQCYTLPERPAMLVPDLPPELDEFICTLLDKNPGRRPATAVGVLEELERIRGKLERKGERLEWPTKLTPDTAETIALPAALGGGSGETELELEPRPLLKRPLVVIPLFLLVLTAITLPFVWPTKSAAELYAKARPLLESDNPDDWEIACEQYLDPLSRKYPDRYVEEIASARAKLKDRRELKRALGEGAKVDIKSDAEGAYLRGLRLAQAGDSETARRIWRAIEVAYGPVASESRWVALSRVGLKALDRPENSNMHGSPDRAAFDAALKHAKSLLTSGKTAEAATAFRALQDLFRDDPAASEAIRQAIENKP